MARTGRGFPQRPVAQRRPWLGFVVNTGTILYPLLGLPAPTGSTLPAGYQGAWGLTQAATGGAGAKQLALFPGAAQQSTSLASTATNQTLGLYQCVSQALAAQPVGAGAWGVGLAGLENVGVAGTAQIFIGVLKADGTGLRGTILPITQVGAAGLSGSETTQYSGAILGGAVTALAGDSLLVEFGALCAVSADTITLCDSGTVLISNDGATIASAQSFLQAPQQLLFLAAAGETPTPGESIMTTEAYSYSETPSAGESVTGSGGPTPTDPATLVEILAQGQIGAVSESPAPGDAPVILAALTTSDAPAVGDAPVASGAPAVRESLSAGESLAQGQIGAVSDLPAPGDAPLILAALATLETPAAGESPAASGAPTVREAPSAGDAQAQGQLASPAETPLPTESPATLVTPVSEEDLAVADVVTALVVSGDITIVVIDPVSVSDTVTALTSLALADALMPQEALQGLASATLPVEATGLQESYSTASSAVPTPDTGMLGDTPSAGGAPTATERPALADTALRLAQVQAQDPATATEAVGTALGVILADVLSVADALTALGAVYPLEAGAILESAPQTLISLALLDLPSPTERPATLLLLAPLLETLAAGDLSRASGAPTVGDAGSLLESWAQLLLRAARESLAVGETALAVIFLPFTGRIAGRLVPVPGPVGALVGPPGPVGALRALPGPAGSLGVTLTPAGLCIWVPIVGTFTEQ